MNSPILPQMLAQVRYRNELSYFDGLEPLRRLLSEDEDGTALRFLESEYPDLERPRNAGVAYALAERYRALGDLGAIQRLYEVDEPQVKKYVLNALWDPGDKGLGPGIVALAVAATSHPDVGVRTEACFVLMNQSDYGTDVSDGVEPLRRLLSDPDGGVRRQAAYAIAVLARKRKYDLPSHLADLVNNLSDPERQARTAAAAALWQLSKRRYDIAPAIPGLVGMLAGNEDVGDEYQKAIGALLHHARKSTEHAQAVANAVIHADLDLEHKSIRRLQDELLALTT